MQPDEQRVLCAASAYEQKYYFNETFSRIPEEVQEELRIICVLFTEEVGGIILFCFDEEGDLQIRTQAAESDYNYDEIGAALMVKEIRRSRQEMLHGLELYYKAAWLGKSVEIRG